MPPQVLRGVTRLIAFANNVLIHSGTNSSILQTIEKAQAFKDGIVDIYLRMYVFGFTIINKVETPQKTLFGVILSTDSTSKKHTIYSSAHQIIDSTTFRSL
jgi:hypothetical protein